ncbi:MAG: excinuclease ABC subunit UvrA [Alphaproteobacteria bacterium]|nr:excinuclease ABC subunit UvrA [Alphaproteobacteria bacterium]
MKKFISIRGAREHNLKNIDVDIPKNQLVVITGLSGSGKSSLAFDTIYAEGQRRYVESLSAYARQFLELMKKPDVDLIEGLSPAISIEQKTTSKNPRSTVGTITEIYDYMRLLWARVGTPYSPATGLPIEAQTIPQIVDLVLKEKEGTRLLILAPTIRERKGEYKKEIAEWQKKGFARLQIDDEMYDIEQTPELDKNKKHSISVVVDRLVLKEGVESRLSQAIEKSLLLADGLVVVKNHDSGEEKLFSEKFSCPVSGFTIKDLEPSLFSFNNPQGACPVCAGLGFKLYIDPQKVIPDPLKSIRQGAIKPWSNLNGDMFQWYDGILKTMLQTVSVDIDTPWVNLPSDVQNAILYGTQTKTRPFEGVIKNMERRFMETSSDWMREELSKYQSNSTCEACHGQRLRPEALAVKIAGKTISEATHTSIQNAKDWFLDIPNHLTPQKQEIAKRILKEINDRLLFLNNVGLGYLSLDRMSGTLSGGESQRIRLASQIGSGLTGVLYVLDEPSIGLHQRDNDKLLETLIHLKNLGNTVIVVEHDEDAIKAADYVLDIGPEAGRHGGHIVAQGTPKDIMENPISTTGQFLSGMRKIIIPSKRRAGNGKFIEIQGACVNNLKNVDVKIPLGTFTCVTGVSGGGKSSLVIETLYKGLNKLINHSSETPGEYSRIRGMGYIDKIIDIDQSPIGRTPRSNPATYVGIFSSIREWFAGLPEAKVRGYKAGRFSFNVKGGRCESCGGDGVLKIEMHFLPDVYVECDACKGKRYNRETLEVTYRDKSIADVLAMTVDEAAEFFDHIPSIRDKCKLLKKVGLGYISLGQSAVTLSGGEAQRIKLAKELSKKSTGKTLYILDEPTTGLHFADVQKLLEVLHALVDQGNSVVVIEHNLDVIKTADYIIDMGPEGGDGGGQVVATGTPEEVAKVEASYTGKYLKKILSKG